MTTYSHTIDMSNRLISEINALECASEIDLINIVSSYPPRIARIAIGSLPNEIAEKILTDDSINKLLEMNVDLSVKNINCNNLSESTLIKILSISPEEVVNIDVGLITNGCARAVIASEPELFNELPSNLQTLEMALLIDTEVKNFVNVSDEIMKALTERWMKGSLIWMHECKIITPPTTPGDLFKALQDTKALSYLSTAYSSFSVVTSHALHFFEPADAWGSAKNDDEKAIVQKAFGREKLIHSANASPKQRKKWLSDEFGL